MVNTPMVAAASAAAPEAHAERAKSTYEVGVGFALKTPNEVPWESLKAAVKALDMASVFGGPPGLSGLVPQLKGNLGFLEKLVMDPNEIKAGLAGDLLANAKRRAARRSISMLGR